MYYVLADYGEGESRRSGGIAVEPTGKGSFEDCRARSIRFPLRLELSYTTLKPYTYPIRGNGRSVNISSTGILFNSQHRFAIGTRLELSINWPGARADSRVHFVVRGCITRRQNELMALRVEFYEFNSSGRWKP